LRVLDLTHSEMRVHGYVPCVERTLSVFALHHPHVFPIPAIARDVFRSDRVFAKHAAHGSSADQSQTTVSPHSTSTAHLSPPGEKRRWRRRRPRVGRAIHHSSNLQSLLLHASTQVSRSVQLRLWGDCECGRVVHIHLPVVLRGGLAGVRWTRRVERHQHTPEMHVWRSRN